MNGNTVPDDRDDVLFAFQRAYENPSNDQVTEWINRYPRFADDIRLHAAIAQNWAKTQKLPGIDVDDDMRSRGYQRVTDALDRVAGRTEKK